MTTETAVIIIVIMSIVNLACFVGLAILVIGTGQKIIGAFNRLMDEIDDLMAGNCMRRCAQRKTKDQLSKDRLTDIAMKELWGQVGGSKEKSPLRPLPEDLIKLKALMEAKELPDIIGICRGCGLLESCPKCDDGLTECEDYIDDTKQQVADESQEEPICYCKHECNCEKRLDNANATMEEYNQTLKEVEENNKEAAGSAQDNKEIPTLNDSHKKALGKCKTGLAQNKAKMADKNKETSTSADSRVGRFWEKTQKQGGDIKASLSDGTTREAKEIEPFIDSTPYGND